MKEHWRTHWKAHALNACAALFIVYAVEAGYDQPVRVLMEIMAPSQRGYVPDPCDFAPDFPTAELSDMCVLEA